MDFRSARKAVLQLLETTAPADVPALLHWMRTTRDFDEFTQDNNDIILKSIATDLRDCLPIEAMLCSEHLALQKIRQQPEPTVHIDAFLYDEDFIDTLCEEGKMSRNYCTVCGSHQTAPLGLPLQLSSAALWGRAEWRVLPIAGNDHKEIPVR
ncbi:uncharacterized protein LOC314128 isoform X6 [Rattus norvegicus]|uniref:uncharacterized protein LOC314128 isoform X6 n=1 Tax=Rattus norvegicus TaxID=10116 RepID=UPI002FD7C2A1